MLEFYKAQSTLTDRYQTTIPEDVRRVLNLGKRDKIHYTISPDGKVTLTRADVAEQDDPVLGVFLDFLARDMTDRPHHLRVMDTGLLHRLQSLTDGVDVDLDEVLPEDGE